MHDARRNPARRDVAEEAAIVGCVHWRNETGLSGSGAEGYNGTDCQAVT
jgi:hypothetical protein